MDRPGGGGFEAELAEDALVDVLVDDLDLAVGGAQAEAIEVEGERSLLTDLQAMVVVPERLLEEARQLVAAPAAA